MEAANLKSSFNAFMLQNYIIADMYRILFRLLFALWAASSRTGKGQAKLAGVQTLGAKGKDSGLWDEFQRYSCVPRLNTLAPSLSRDVERAICGPVTRQCSVKGIPRLSFSLW